MWIQRFIFVCLCIWPFIASAYLNQITDLHVERHDTHCRLSLDATAPIQYHVITLSNPARLVLDVRNAHVVRFFQRRLLADTPIKDIRIGSHQNHQLRLVFDLKQPVGIKAYSLKPANHQSYYQLVLDLHWKQSTARPRYVLDDAPSHAKMIESTTIPKRSKEIIVVIDPGHGGKDPGAIGVLGAEEKNIVYQISKELQQAINQQAGFRAYLTRTGDYYLPLRDRLAIARKYKADLFIAIHADVYRDHQARGATVFTLSQRGATSEAARWLAKRENESELMGGVDLADKNNLLKSVLINLSQSATIHASLSAGQEIIKSLANISSLHHKKIEQAAFVVLKSPDVPSLLIETGFISNPKEESRLINKNYQQHLAMALMRGIKTYFMRSPPQGTFLSQEKFSSESNRSSFR